MIRTKSIKIWTLLSQAFIIIGMGHGGAIFGILEAFSLVALFTRPGPSDGSHVSGAILELVGLLSLAGQIVIIVSIYSKRKVTEVVLHMSGLFLLWSALVTYAYGIRNDGYAHLPVVTCVPFLYCTIRTLAGRFIQRLWERILQI